MKSAQVFIVLFGFLCFAHAQVQFYGKPEPINSLNSTSGEQYMYIDHEQGRAYFCRVVHEHNKGGKKDPSDIWVGSIFGGEVAHWAFNDGHFAAPIGKGASGDFRIFGRVWPSKGTYKSGVFAVSGNGKSYRKITIPYFKNQSKMLTGCLSPDNKCLILSLENNLGYGVEDLYVCKLQDDGTWGSPKNMGNKINTPLQEITPFLAEDNKTLFFASNGHKSEGSFDIFMATRLDGTWQNWSEAVNLGPHVNTSGAESSFSFKKGTGYAYYISTQNSEGYGDIKRIRIDAKDIDPGVALKIPGQETRFELKEKGSMRPLEGTATVEGRFAKYSTNDAGTIKIPVHKEVKIAFKSQGHLSINHRAKPGQQACEILMEPLRTGNTIALDHVFFYRTNARFLEGAESQLNLVVEMMNENPEVNIFLKGHTDNLGNATLNLQLSKERVEAVKQYLVENGISERRIDGEGFGSSLPLKSNKTEATRKYNRRVEFEIRR